MIDIADGTITVLDVTMPPGSVIQVNEDGTVWIEGVVIVNSSEAH